MDTIVLSVSALVALIEELKADNMDFVQLSLQPADLSNPNNPVPACAFVSAIKRSDPDLSVDYDDLEECTEGLTIFNS